MLYMRKYRVIVGGVDVSDLRCTFVIEKSIGESPNYCEVSIYNLAPSTENQIIESGERAVLEAGYENSHYGIIFDGDIVSVSRDKEDSVTYKLTVHAGDGDLFLNGGFVNASYAAGQTPMTIAQLVTSGAKFPAELGNVSDNLENKKLARGKVCFGLAKEYLHQIARTEQAAFYCNDGRVNVIKGQDPPEGQVVSLTPKSGLVGTVEAADDGIQATCLLNPLIVLNGMVHVDNTSVEAAKGSRGSQVRQVDYSGAYRIIKFSHKGDTTGNEWYTEFVGVAQDGGTPVTGESLR